jgi:hypothetical protein
MSLLSFIGGEMTKKKNRKLTKNFENFFRTDFDFSCVSVEAIAFIGFAY